MNLKKHFKLLITSMIVVVMTGCATKSVPFDYAAYKESRPRSILVIPPLNNTPDGAATYSVLSHATLPLAEAGYYVMPVSLVAEAFKENGITQPADMHTVPADKLRKIFGADAALYIVINKYGTVYQVLNSASVVSATANLIDLKTGKVLWTGTASASSEEGQNQQGGLAVLLVAAIVKQVLGNALDQSHQVAGVATTRLLSAGMPNGILYGPRSPNYKKE